MNRPRQDNSAQLRNSSNSKPSSKHPPPINLEYSPFASKGGEGNLGWREGGGGEKRGRGGWWEKEGSESWELPTKDKADSVFSKHEQWPWLEQSSVTVQNRERQRLHQLKIENELYCQEEWHAHKAMEKRERREEERRVVRANLIKVGEEDGFKSVKMRDPSQSRGCEREDEKSLKAQITPTLRGRQERNQKENPPQSNK